MQGTRKAGSMAAVLVVAALATGCEDPVELVFNYAASSPIHSTPMLSKDSIIFGSENGEVVSLSRTGEYRWKYSTRREVVVAVKEDNGLVFFGSTNNQFYALDLSGGEVWKYTTLSRIKGDPLVTADLVIFGSYDKHVYALNKTAPQRVWIFPDDNAGAPLQPGEADKDKKDDKADAKGKDKGKGKGKDKDKDAKEPEAPPAPVIPSDGFSYSSPVMVGDNVVLGNLDGYLYAVNAANGTLAWHYKTQGADAKKGVTSTVLETKDALVFGANDANIYAISKDGQKTLWTFKTKDEVNATAIQDDAGNLYVGGVDHGFYSLDASGKERWRFTLNGPVMGRAALVQNLVVFGGGAGDQTIYAVDKDTGKLFWKQPTEGKIEADVVSEGNRIYVASGDRRLWCYQFNKTKPD